MPPTCESSSTSERLKQPSTVLRSRTLSLLAILSATLLSACATHSTVDLRREPAAGTLAQSSDWTIASPPGQPRPPFQFNTEDDRLLEEIERASFLYLWTCCDDVTGMVRDRTSTKMISIAGVGFQLAAIPAAVARGWITEQQGRDRSLLILRSLESNPSNRKAGLFYHFLEPGTAAPINNDAVSTIDSAILFAGILVSGERFGGEARERAARLFAAADWAFFVINEPRKNEPYLKGFISLGWKPKNFKNPTGDGNLLPYAWADAGDEQRLVCFLAAAAPLESHRVDPSIYYRLRRMLGDHNGSGVHVWFPWSGALFTHFFAHCFIDYAHQGPDNPAASGATHRPSVDWWENSRRAVNFHRAKAIEDGATNPAFGADSWGLSACDCPTGYCVPGIYPTRIALSDQLPQVDYADFAPKNDLGDGTIAPYAAGCAIMFDPAVSLAALRHYRGLKLPGGEPIVWREPPISAEGRTPSESGDSLSAPGGLRGSALMDFGFRDSFNLGKGWTAPDCVAIDQGPLVLALENARSGLIWRLFSGSPEAKAAAARLGWAIAPK